jgi:peptidoglycan/xylan/chitin deacetylase (PgdA/CDA1 family)
MLSVPNPLVLCYHSVSSTWSAPLAVTPDQLERQMRWLVDHGWQAATFRDIIRGSHRRTVAITFDDAFESVAGIAYPILSSLGLKATVFAPTGYIGERGGLRWPEVEHWIGTPDERELAAMSWDTLGTLLEAGWEVGSHTRSHPHLTALDDATLQAELEDSRDACRAMLDVHCDTIAYPFGDVNDRVVKFAREAGYVAGATLPRRLAGLGPYRVPRVGIYRDDRWWRFRLKLNPAVRRARRSAAWPDPVAKARHT